MFELMDAYSQSAVIKVIGVGGGGGRYSDSPGPFGSTYGLTPRFPPQPLHKTLHLWPRGVPCRVDHEVGLHLQAQVFGKHRLLAIDISVIDRVMDETQMVHMGQHGRAKHFAIAANAAHALTGVWNDVGLGGVMQTAMVDGL